MCPPTMMYSVCGAACQPGCRDLDERAQEICDALPCVEGCVCPPGTQLQGNDGQTNCCYYKADHLGLRPANERRRYFVTTSLIGWAQT